MNNTESSAGALSWLLNRTSICWTRDYLSLYISFSLPLLPILDISSRYFKGLAGLYISGGRKKKKEHVRSIDTEIIHCISLIRFSNHAAGNRDLTDSQMARSLTPLTNAESITWRRTRFGTIATDRYFPRRIA